MKVLVATMILLYLLVGCSELKPSPPQVNQWIAGNVQRFKDEEAGVVCWVWYKTGGISCLPIKDTRLGE